ncbi:hypothetical protein AAJ76_2880001637 [Vairimorpha ceranae]|uniref:Uncharacterized protein n=1 Tax=Vairimorpha ceranae TaxID=40302 RepID=A0A0F9W7C5_9MICR|nr:hypothetical protein AAJ76_2880001637 [Vairimorpha ceranae]KKO73706.1 hypothetical protein AAJ76_2880001637 [Vairimorpha ceranae]
MCAPFLMDMMCLYVCILLFLIINCPFYYKLKFSIDTLAKINITK